MQIKNSVYTNRKLAWFSWFILIAGLLTTGIVYFQIKIQINNELSSKLDSRINQAKYGIERQVNAYTEVLWGVKAQFAANPDLSRQAFQKVAGSLDLTHRLPGILAIGFTQKIVPGTRDALRISISRDSLGYPPSSATNLTASTESFLIQYIEPIAKNQRGAWADQALEPKRRAAIEQARDTGEWVASGRVRLFSDPGNVDGIVLYMPLYHGGETPATVSQRREKFYGTVFLGIKVDNMLRSVLGAELLDDLHIDIYGMHGFAPSSMRQDPANFIFNSGNHIPAPRLQADPDKTSPGLWQELTLGGSTWHMHVTALPAFARYVRDGLPSLAAMIGVLLSLGSFFLMRVLEYSRQASDAYAREVERSLQFKQKELVGITESIDEVLWTFDFPGWKINYVSPAVERVYGRPTDAFYADPNLWLKCVHPADRQKVIALSKSLVDVGCKTFQYRIVRPDGEERWIRYEAHFVPGASRGIGRVDSVGSDITQQHRLEESLRNQASHDSLTGLPNRSLLQDRLHQAIGYSANSASPIWIAFIDLDRFKFVNDSVGHKAGDILLKNIAKRLQSAVRSTDTVARLGGDEFVLLMSERTDRTASSAAAAMQRILDAVAQPLIIDGQEFFPTCSLGVTVYPTDGEDADTLMKNADAAMYRAKQQGGNSFQFFTPSMNEEALGRLQIEGDLRRALARGEFLLHYQPQIDLRSGRIVGMEALVRWMHPTLGMIAPARFIGLAEEIGLIVPIGTWVLRTACAQCRTWQQAGLGHLRIAVNLSARQFAQKDLVSMITAILKDTGLAPNYLDIELTESSVVKDVERAVNILRELKTIGVQVSIDDFGTGYSSLSSLKRFPINVLKIDRSFVRDIATNSDDAAIVLSIISLAHNMKLKVIAEGVETQEQLDYLRRHGCEEMQGYYFSKPVAAAAFEQILRSGRNLALEFDSAAA